MYPPANASLSSRSLASNREDIPRALWWEDGAIRMLDQTRLPSEEHLLHITEVDELIESIVRLSVRGAPALGVAGAYGVLLVARDWKSSSAPADFSSLRTELKSLEQARPTAVNLSWAINTVVDAAESQSPETKAKAYNIMEARAQELHEDDKERCRKIGEYGAALLREKSNIITHCNTGALATGGIGTALGVIYTAAMHGKRVQVFADETRPLLQGARLTAWELDRANIPVTVMTDGMAASLMQQEPIDAVIVGADRIANNGDAANKIGTYQLAIAAQAHEIPFYVAAPTSTVDMSLESGEEIPIEMRGGDEIITWGNIKTAPDNVGVYAPAFDVTPAQYITGIITEIGIARNPYDFRGFIRSWRP
ncbi:MAG: S-methyl-5-thioribose-1-phosphate isomerase [Candidatus Marinimicrobia bacterium]|nr:S-methyl-5-thioribose-1-phosphate isomerase [Candidatus Neomarinimicrobiota bacterium]MCF7829214.1 S-methyl-5-thioribose-1-phosphate isomerase [Candidatus Neomarinimicrobiota bacterium]MCF7881133.1 S-methyl-5-thioribose-1-phosphate isomerase [Candidatus Neomarinimicrobiota bacterium]